jgi:hypothetical protein
VTGLALALLDDYEATYRLLGLLMPVVAIGLWMSARQRAARAQTDSVLVASPVEP